MESSVNSGDEMEQSFSVAAGEYTAAEREYLQKKGLVFKNSLDETLDISTEVESLNSSSLSRSHLDSLIIFEENEKLYAQLLNKSGASVGDMSPMKADNSSKCMESPEMQLSRMSKLNLNESPVCLDYDHDGNEEEEDKENEFKGPCGVQRILFREELEKVRDPLEEIKGIVEQSSLMGYESEKSQDETSELSDYEICMVPCTQIMENASPAKIASDIVEIVPCTQNASFSEISEPKSSDLDDVDFVPCTQIVENASLHEEESPVKLASEIVKITPCTQNASFSEITEPKSCNLEDVDFVPCTQELNISINLNQTYTSVSLEDSLSEELVPCTQAQEASLLSTDGEISRLDTTSDVLCSQGSTVDGSSRGEELNDTIAWMEHALKEADKLEAKEKLAAEQAEIEKSLASEAETAQLTDVCDAATSQNDPADNDEVFFKTPLKHTRVQLLKNKKVASPSPPRSFANALLQQRGTTKAPVPVSTKEKKLAIARTSTSRSSTSSSATPMSTSTPKRAPVTNTTPATKKNHTPGRGGVFKTPVAAKIDTGLRGSPFSIGLSPVAKYIYDKPVPSKFARVQAVANPKAATAATANTSLSRIPLPPVRTSQAQMKPKTPGSAAKQPRYSVLRTSTYFNMNCTPPQIVANEKTAAEKKRFQPLQYTGASKVKTLNGNVESPRSNDYVAHRHTGLRDESGNASFIQNTMIYKRNIPVQSRLTTPKSEIDSGKSRNSPLPSTPVRSETFIISK